MLAMLFTAVAVLAQGGSGPATAPAAAPAAPSATASAASGEAVTVSPLSVTASRRMAPDPSEVICHDELPPGTRFAKKVCATRAMFDERRRDQQELIREWQATPITTARQ